MTPIFIFSLPRSGSTLLQRILMSHPDIATTAEPWVLLPLCYSIRKSGVLTEYIHRTSYDAITDFIATLPNKKQDYYEAIRLMASSLYGKQCKNGERYFLDKTPRYYNVIDDIKIIFPDAKFIFLFRSPVAVFASIVETWCSGRFKGLFPYYRDLYYGIDQLSVGYRKHKEVSHALNYEDLVAKPEQIVRELCDYLGISYDNSMLKKFVYQKNKGRMGDPTGIVSYKCISDASAVKWKCTFNNSFRKTILLKYINALNDEQLKLQGYEKKNLLDEIASIKTLKGFFMRDRIDFFYSQIMQFIKPNIWFGNSAGNWSRKTFIS